jgi:hypothetical protein
MVSFGGSIYVGGRRGPREDLRRLTVADGYHRICASYHLDPDSEIPCRVVNRGR